MSAVAIETKGRQESLFEEFLRYWRGLPCKAIFFGLLLAWVAFFHFLGNSTLGYINTPSLFGWMDYSYTNSDDDAHGKLIPFVVVVLLWWKREELLAVEKRHWWPALAMFVFAILIHVLGYVVQQTRISIAAFFIGVYALTGLVWGPKWLRVTFFPFVLFIFCLPFGTIAETLTFPLRVLATKVTTAIAHTVFGINVIQDGTRIFNPDGSFQYEVAAACSGLRSLTATLAIAMIYGFVAFRKGWKRMVIIGSAVPMAVAANVFRLSTIILAAQGFGQNAGNYVHDSSWLSLWPYLPAIGGIFVVGYFIKDRERVAPDNQSEAAV